MNPEPVTLTSWPSTRLVAGTTELVGWGTANEIGTSVLCMVSSTFPAESAHAIGAARVEARAIDVDDPGHLIGADESPVLIGLDDQNGRQVAVANGRRSIFTLDDRDLRTRREAGPLHAHGFMVDQAASGGDLQDWGNDRDILERDWKIHRKRGVYGLVYPEDATVRSGAIGDGSSDIDETGDVEFDRECSRPIGGRKGDPCEIALCRAGRAPRHSAIAIWEPGSKPFPETATASPSTRLDAGVTDPVGKVMAPAVLDPPKVFKATSAKVPKSTDRRNHIATPCSFGGGYSGLEGIRIPWHPSLSGARMSRRLRPGRLQEKRTRSSVVRCSGWFAADRTRRHVQAVRNRALISAGIRSNALAHSASVPSSPGRPN